MLTTIMKWTSLVALFGALLFWSPGNNYAVVLQLIVCGSAAFVALEAAQSGKKLWAAAFVGLVVLSHPLLTVASRSQFPWVCAVCCSMFLASLRVLKTIPKPFVPSRAYTEPQS
jgi:hypothetical protein